MNAVQTEIAALEEGLRRAELGPDAEFFDRVLADNVALISEDGERFTKTQVVDAHRPGKGSPFTRVDMSEIVILDHGPVAVVTCTGAYEGPQFTGALRFLRVWQKTDNRWQIIAAAVYNG
jgi:hypothetical protein